MTYNEKENAFELLPIGEMEQAVSMVSVAPNDTRILKAWNKMIDSFNKKTAKWPSMYGDFSLVTLDL